MSDLPRLQLPSLSLPDRNYFHDVSAAADEWQLASSAMAGSRPTGFMRLMNHDGNYPKTKDLRKRLSPELPVRPAAVELFDINSSTCQVIAVDVDAKHVTAEKVATDAEAIVQLLRLAGYTPWIDVSPSGGRHVQAVLAEPLPQRDVYAWLRALKTRYPSVDVSPASHVGACLRPTGSPHALGGYQRHLGTLEELQAAVAAVPAADAWEHLCGLIPPLDGNEHPVETYQRPIPGVVLTGKDIGAKLHRQAVYGPDKPEQQADQSAFQWAVEKAAFEAGFTESEYVQAVVKDWPWLRHSYGRRGRRPDIEAARKFQYAQQKAKRKQNQLGHLRSDRNIDTSHLKTPHPRPSNDPALATRQWISWSQKVGKANKFTAYERWLVIVLGFFALSKQSLQVDGGLRSYALGCGMSHEAVRVGLQKFAELGLIRRVTQGRARDADTWELVVDQVGNERPAAGWIESLRKAFTVLGPMAGEIYELLVTHGHADKPRKKLRKRPTGKGIRQKRALSSSEIAQRTGYSTTQVNEVLALLDGWDLAKKIDRSGAPRGWIAGKADPNHVAWVLGADDAWDAKRRVYARQRLIWHQWLDGIGRKPKARDRDAWQLFEDDMAALSANDPPEAWADPFVDIPPWALPHSDTGT